MASAPLSPISQAYVKHTPPAAANNNCSPIKPKNRNTVHWEFPPDLHNSIKENAVPDALVDDLSLQKLSSLKDSPRSTHTQAAPIGFGELKTRGQHQRAQLSADTFVAPGSLVARSGTQTDIGAESLGEHDLVKAARRLDPNENVFDKHRKKRFQWVLSLPTTACSHLDISEQILACPPVQTGCQKPGEGDRRYFGCNLLTWTKTAGRENSPPGDPDDKYLLLATPIDLKPDQGNTANVEFTTHQFRILQEDTQNLDMAPSGPMATPTSTTRSPYRPSPLGASSAQWSTAAGAAEESDNTLTMDSRHEMKEPLSTIEDSLEEIDQLDDEIEAMTAAAGRMLIKEPQPKPSGSRQETTSFSPKTAKRNMSPAASNSVHQTTRPREEIGYDDREDAQTPTSATLRKVARPASLAPPKPIQKAKKVPTIPTFELPGERVARELKEKKAARLSMQLDPQKVVQAAPSQRAPLVRSSKQPTVPDFELPGERYSRLKKERLEQKLREEEEEMRRRRQFKARPSPATGGATVRSTFTSRQRQNNGGQSQQSNAFSPNNEQSPRAGAAKRQSMTITPSTMRNASNTSASTVSTAARGRTSSMGSTHVSTRATSSSAGSVASASKRSSVSTEELKLQKARAKNIYARDSIIGQSKEQEKRDREEAIKLARQKYAQMSRNVAVQGRAKRDQ